MNKISNYLFTFLGSVLIAAVFSGCGASTSNSNKPNSPANRAANAANYAEVYAKAPSGASPAHYKGGQTAAVTIEEFADYQCPTCALLHPIVQQIQAAYGDRVKIIFRNFPLQMHPKAYDAAVAAEAGGLQGKFWEMQHRIFTNQQSWSNAPDHRKIFENYAQEIGLDVEKFRNDVAGMAAKSRVDNDMQRARALGVGSTPTFYINGRPLSYEETKEYNVFRQAIDAELQKVSGANQSPPSAPAATTTPAAANTSGANTSTGNANKAEAKK